MPKMSDTMEEGKVIRWLKQQGDKVTEGEPIAEIETDKANVEMEAFEPGILKDILVKEGDTVAVGAPIATIEAPETAGAPAVPPQEIVHAGEQPEIPSQKAPEPYTAEQIPLVTAPPPPEATQPAPERIEKPTQPPEEERIKASPLARKLAEERGIDLSKIQGTGPNGRIVEADIESYSRQAQAPEAKAPEAPAPQAPPPPQATPAPKPAAPRMEVPSEEVELSKMRKTIAHRMSQSKQTIPHFYITVDIAMDRASMVRDELNAMDGSRPKISFTDMIIKASALALREFPQVNASYHEDKLRVHKEINVGMAVALEDGLVVPVVHEADQKDLHQIAEDTKSLAERARSGGGHMSDYTGGTFTVSNLGMFDVEEFSSIINPPEAASLAVGTITDTPVVIDGEIGVSKRMKATLAADHRVMDGAVAAKFMQALKKRLEAPTSLL